LNQFGQLILILEAVIGDKGAISIFEKYIVEFGENLH
jgi:hypothetical protein